MDGDCSSAPNGFETAPVLIASRSDVAIVCGRRRERYPDASITIIPATSNALACGGDALGV